MADTEVAEETIYRVVVNHEEQYSIWPADRECPLGWRDGGKTGPKAECLAHIDQVWTDMRPLSLRREMQRLAENPPAPDQAAPEPRPADPRDDLVVFLSTGEHPVEVTASSTEHFLERLDSGYVNIKFTDTRGGTELGIKLDSDAAGSGIDREKGQVRIIGSLTLNYRPVRLTADVALDTLKGFGCLQLTNAGS